MVKKLLTKKQRRANYLQLAEKLIPYQPFSINAICILLGQSLGGYCETPDEEIEANYPEFFDYFKPEGKNKETTLWFSYDDNGNPIEPKYTAEHRANALILCAELCK